MAGEAGVPGGRTGSGTTRFAAVDALRALAAISVLVFHVSFAFPAPESGLSQFLTQRNSGIPVTGVVLFFVISGFVLYRPFVLARHAGTPAPALVPYAVRRVARIVPAYWLALAIATVWLGYREVESVGGVVRYFGFLQLYGPRDVVEGGIGPAWSLCVEVTFYAALPAIAWGLRRVRGTRADLRGELGLCALLLVASLLWQLGVLTALPGSHPLRVPLLRTLPGSLELFAAGMALAVVTVHGLPGRVTALLTRAPWAPMAAGLGVFYLAGWALRYAGGAGFGPYFMATELLKAAGSVLVLAPVVVGSGGWLRRGLTWRPLLWLGTVSYGIYLWHVPLKDGLAPHLVSHGRVVTTLAVLAASVAVASVSYVLLERPAIRLAQRYPSRRIRSSSSASSSAEGAEAVPAPVATG